MAFKNKFTLSTCPRLHTHSIKFCWEFFSVAKWSSGNNENGGLGSKEDCCDLGQTCCSVRWPCNTLFLILNADIGTVSRIIWNKLGSTIRQLVDTDSWLGCYKYLHKKTCKYLRTWFMDFSLFPVHLSCFWGIRLSLIVFCSLCEYVYLLCDQATFSGILNYLSQFITM